MSLEGWLFSSCCDVTGFVEGVRLPCKLFHETLKKLARHAFVR